MSNQLKFIPSQVMLWGAHKEHELSYLDHPNAILRHNNLENLFQQQPTHTRG